MPPLFTFAAIQGFILVKACFFAFLILGVVGVYKKWKPVYFLLLLGGLSSLAYIFLVRGTALPLWGLKGDEITIAAMYETFAHARWWGDFAYAHLPPFYPPLWFWLFGIIERVRDLNGVQIGKIASVATIAVYPIVFYFLQ
jgi:hypothetical protein